MRPTMSDESGEVIEEDPEYVEWVAHYKVALKEVIRMLSREYVESLLKGEEDAEDE
jgi:hypothetical protein